MMSPDEFSTYQHYQERIRDLESQLTAATERAEKAEADAKRLDFIESRGTPGMLWHSRQSTTGRGYRLHQDPSGEFLSAREAIDAARLQEQPK